jgi:hypothetical protein
MAGEGDIGRECVLKTCSYTCCEEKYMGVPDAKIWLGEDGIVRIKYPDNCHITMEIMESVFEQHLQITTDKRPILADCGTVASVDYDAQQFVSNDERAALTSALAVIVKSAFTRAMGQMFMMFHKPPYPTRMFQHEEDALEWLRTFLTADVTVSEKRMYKP